MLTAIVRCIQSILVNKYCQEIKGISRAVGRSLWYKENLQCMEENMSTGGSLERAEVELAVHKIPLRKCTQYEYMNTLPGENSEMIQGCAYRILQICIDCWLLLQDLQTTSLRLHTQLSWIPQIRLLLWHCIQWQISMRAAAQHLLSECSRKQKELVEEITCNHSHFSRYLFRLNKHLARDELLFTSNFRAIPCELFQTWNAYLGYFP